MGQLLELFVLLDVDEELGQTVENKLSFIDENIDFILEEFFAIFLEFLRHGSTEHHNLLVVGCFDKNLLNVSSHVWVSENFVAFVNDKEFALFKVNDFVSGQVKKSTWSCDDDVRDFGWIFELGNVVLEWNTSEIGAISKLGFFEVAT